MIQQQKMHERYGVTLCVVIRSWSTDLGLKNYSLLIVLNSKILKKSWKGRRFREESVNIRGTDRYKSSSTGRRHLN
jgi:hypothetical protein